MACDNVCGPVWFLFGCFAYAVCEMPSVCKKAKGVTQHGVHAVRQFAASAGKVLCCFFDLSSRTGRLCRCSYLGPTTGQGPFQRL